jgi:hypothetical protein
LGKVARIHFAGENMADDDNAALVLVEKCISDLALACGAFDVLSNNAVSQALALLRGVLSFNRKAPTPREAVEPMIDP